MADLLATKSVIKEAVIEGTNAKQTHTWNHCKSYFFSIGRQDKRYLTELKNTETSVHLLKHSDDVVFVTKNLPIQCQIQSELPGENDPKQNFLLSIQHCMLFQELPMVSQTVHHSETSND